MIETSRLFLAQPQNEDILAIENLWRDTKIRQFLGGVVSDDVIKDKINDIQKHWELHKFGQWVIFEKTSNEIIGLCGLIHSKDGIELTYMFFPKFWGKGFAKETIKAIIHYGFNNLKIDEIIAITQEANSRSCQLLKKVDMIYISSFERFNAKQCLFKLKRILSNVKTCPQKLFT